MLRISSLLAGEKILTSTSSSRRDRPTDELGYDVKYKSLPKDEDGPTITPKDEDNLRDFRSSKDDEKPHFSQVLPVLWMEFMALSLTRAIIPPLLVETYEGDEEGTQHSSSSVYVVMGWAECIRGLLAFVSCPMFGKISDKIGRKPCLWIAVAGTCLPVVVYYIQLIFLLLPCSSEEQEEEVKRMMIGTFVTIFSISGLFSSTFTLTFAYISDTLTTSSSKPSQRRIVAYGLALATFGLAFTIGPITGAYLAKTSVTSSHSSVSVRGQCRVFTASFLFVLCDLFYIYYFLPESNIDIDINDEISHRKKLTSPKSDQQNYAHNSWMAMSRNYGFILPWRILNANKFLWKVGLMSFYYYTAFWAVVSTLSLYVTKRFKMSPQQLGELMSTLGLCTILSEAVLVRYIPQQKEIVAIQIGLAAFAMQCVLLGFASQYWQIYICVALSLLGNLVYPSITSLVSSSSSYLNYDTSIALSAEGSNRQQQFQVGEVLGAIHGIKALTEGIGPLLFGLLMSLSENYHKTNSISSFLPQGWPYILLTILPLMAYRLSHELLKHQNQCDEYDDLLLLQSPQYRNMHHINQNEDEQELVNLIS